MTLFIFTFKFNTKKKMTLDKRFTDAQIDTICQQGVNASCACPSHLSNEIKNIRSLFHYQNECLIEDKTVLKAKSHKMLKEATQIAHAVLELCLKDILINEEWDMETLTMPTHLREKLELPPPELVIKSSQFQ